MNTPGWNAPRTPDSANKAQAFSDGELVRALEGALGSSDRETVGTQIGPYKLLQKIGEGGFGVVWMAEQTTPFARRVALKIVKAGMDTDELIARFEAERQALALLEHPNIARVFDAGTTASGRPYFVMELVRGVPVTQYCDSNLLTAEQRLRLFLPICHAIQHAHQKGIIHRDLKPSNILVTLHDGAPVPKVIDFGVAKALDKRLTEKTLVTQFHAFVGTPVYTSPEQMEMSGLDVDTRSDIYSLGVLLYELLAGRPPFDPEQLAKSGLDAMRRLIRESDPPRPSHRLFTLTEADRTSVAHQRGTDVARLQVFLRGDVDWIVMRCMEKDRTRRYGTATALAEDIQHHLQNEPVTARPPSRAYQAGKFIRRHRVGVLAFGAITLSLVAGSITSSILFISERAARGRAVAAEQAEAKLRRQAEEDRTIEAKRASRTAQALAEQLFKEGRTSEGLAHLVRAARSDPDNYAIGPRLIATLAYRNFALPIDTSLSGIAAADYLKNQPGFWTIDNDGLVQVKTPDRKTQPIVFNTAQKGQRDIADRISTSTDGARFAIADNRGFVTVYDLGTGNVVHSTIDHASDIVRIAYSPDNRLIATSGTDRQIKLWDAGSGRLLSTLKHSRVARTMTFSADSKKLVSSTNTRGDWYIWSVPKGTLLTAPIAARSTASTGVFSPDNRMLALCDNYGVQIIDQAQDYRVIKILDHSGPCFHAEFSPDGKLLATGSDDTTVRFWDVPTGAPKGEPLRHSAGITQLRFIRGGQQLITTSGDGYVRIWDVNTGKPLQEPIGIAEVRSVAVTSDGGELMTLSRDHTLRRWHLAMGAISSVKIPENITEIDLMPNRNTGDTAWVLHRRKIQEIDLLSGRPIGTPREFPIPAGSGRLSSGATFACVFAGAQRWEIWDLREKEIKRHPLGANLQADSILFSPTLSHLAGLDRDFSLRVWNTTTGAVAAGPIGNVNRISTFAFSPVRPLVAVGVANRLTIYDLTNGAAVGEPLIHGTNVRSIAFSPDGNLLAVGEIDAVRVWNLKTRELVSPLLPHRGHVRNLEFSRDSRRLLTCDPLAARLWDTAKGTLLLPPLTGGNDLTDASFTEDETCIATWARTNSEIRLWSVAEGCLLVDPVCMNTRIFERGTLLTKKLYIARTTRGPIHVWPLLPPPGKHRTPEWLLRLATALASGETDPTATFRHDTHNPQIFDEIRRELSLLPREAPFSEWGRWFLADRATRPISPGFHITAREQESAERHAATEAQAATELLTLRDRGNALRSEGNYAAAVALYLDLLERLERIFGHDSLEACKLLQILSETLLKAKMPVEAERTARDLLARSEKLYGKDELGTFHASFFVGWSLLAQKRFEEAESYLSWACEGIATHGHLGESDPETQAKYRQYAQMLARVYDSLHQPEKAAFWREKAAVIPQAKRNSP